MGPLNDFVFRVMTIGQIRWWHSIFIESFITSGTLKRLFFPSFPVTPCTNDRQWPTMCPNNRQSQPKVPPIPQKENNYGRKS